MIAATLITVIVTFSDWLENPGAIFRDEDGTNWPIVFETIESWFLPTFLTFTIITSVAHLSKSTFLKLKRSRSNS